MTEIELLETFSSNLKLYRKEKTLTQEKLAEAAELSVQAVNFFEGKRRFPSPDSLVKIADALGVEVYQLFIPQNKTPIIIEETPETELLRQSLQKEILSDLRKSVNRVFDKFDDKVFCSSE